MVSYDPETGLMLWLPKSPTARDFKRWNTRYAGKQCGTIDDKGYRRILYRLDPGKTFKVRAHRLAWFCVHGVMPVGEIDHINQDKLDNKIKNLRDVSRELNQRNGTRKGNNTSGVPGVTWHKQRGKWCAQAGVDGKHHHLGLFDCIKEAEMTVKIFRAQRGFTETHGRVV